MHQLILLRHAKAAGATAEVADHNRSLTTEGRRAAAAMGAAMRAAGLIPDVILVSSALRTQQTLDALEPWEDRPSIETLHSLYMASYMQIRDTLRDLPETVRSVLVIAHNPGIHELAQLLAGDAATEPGSAFGRLADAYPTATLTEFHIPIAWRKIGPAGAELKRFLQPSDLAPVPRDPA